MQTLERHGDRQCAAVDGGDAASEPRISLNTTITVYLLALAIFLPGERLWAADPVRRPSACFLIAIGPLRGGPLRGPAVSPPTCRSFCLGALRRGGGQGR